MNLLTIDKIKALSVGAPIKGEWLQGRDSQNGLYYDFLVRLTQSAQPSLVIELGTNKGDSACRFAFGCPSAKVITVDIAGSETIDERVSHFDNLRFIKGNTNDMSLSAQLCQPGEADILFIDTEHSKSQATGEYINYGPLVRKGGIILFDDILLPTGIHDFWETLTEPKIELNHIHETGFGVKIKTE
ncbi:MAG: class I SAM-dependent methyltransferase [bacterium]|nr:class I SAM-dependent methyltransferase [bacterium]